MYFNEAFRRDLMFDGQPIVDETNWNNYVDSNLNGGFLNYVEATTSITNKLSDIANRHSSFEELKTELFNFIKERKAFVTFAENNLP